MIKVFPSLVKLWKNIQEKNFFMNVTLKREMWGSHYTSDQTYSNRMIKFDLGRLSSYH